MKASNFIDPGMEFRGTDLWMLNDRLEAGELEKQMEEMKKAGCGAFIARTFIGLISDYPGEDYLGKMEVIIKKARETGQKVFLQAGYMPGGVFGLPKEYNHMAVREVRAEDCQAEDVTVMAEAGGIKYCLSAVDNYLDLLNPAAVRYYMKIAYADIWERFKDDFGKTVVSVWVDEPHFNPPHLPWTEKLPVLFEKTWGYRLEDNILLLFCCREGYQKVRYHYWRTVLAMLKKAYFEEISKWCRDNNLKFSGHLMGEDSLKAQVGFTCSTMPLYKYMDIPGIDFLTADTRWVHGAVTGEGRYRSVLTPLQCVSAAHQAGKSDILCEMYGVSTEGLTFRDQRYFLDYFTALGITHRCVHGLFYSLKGRRKRFYVPHFSYSQPWWIEYKSVTDYCGRVSWFMRQGRPMADILVLHPIESAFMEYDSADMENIYKKSLEEIRNADLKIDRMHQSFIALVNNLLGMHSSFELGDEDTLAEWGEVQEDGTLKVGHMSYRAVVLPNMLVLRQSSLEILKDFVKAGGKLLSIGSAPYMIDGLPDKRCLELEGLRTVEDIGMLKSVLKEVCPAEYGFNCSDDSNLVWINVRTTGEDRIVFIFNSDKNKSCKGVLAIKGVFEAEEWQGESGKISGLEAIFKDGCTQVPVYLEAGSSRMLVLKNAMHREAVLCNAAVQADSTECPNALSSVGLYELKGSWNISRKNPNALPLDFCSYKKGEGEFSPLYPVPAVQQILTEEDYKGLVTLRFQFHTAFIPENIKLVMEEPEKCNIKINGRYLSVGITGDYYLDRAFKILDVSGEITEGLNTIEITRHFEPLKKAASIITELFQSLPGVELEALYLTGDFGALSSTETTSTGCIRFNRSFSLVREKGVAGRELTVEGYPFYAGAMVLKKTFALEEIPEGRKAVLKVKDFRACAGNVHINGINAGKLSWEPFELDITGMLVKGENKIEIELINTLRNLLGPYHRPEGELLHCWGEYPWTGDFDYIAAVRHPGWYEDRVPDTVTWTEYYMQLPFGIDSVEIFYPEEQVYP